jgi:glyoxylase-like metal-dependent hydrolase (beta-lactamase superfamily II)
MNVFSLTLGPLATNCYLVSQPGSSQALLIDAAGDPDEIVAAARSHRLEIRLLVLTHGHIDHIEAATEIRRAAGAQLAIHELDAPMLTDSFLSGASVFGFPQKGVPADRLLKGDDVVSLDGTDISLTVLHTPGHTPGSICLIGAQSVFSGDCLFAGGIGRTDLPGGDDHAMIASLRRLIALDPGLAVYPGHGPATTIGAEREGYPWLGGR